MKRTNWIWLIAIIIVVAIGIGRRISAHATTSQDTSKASDYATTMESMEDMDSEEYTSPTFEPLPTTSTSSSLEIPAPRNDGYYPNAESIAVMAGRDLNYTFYYDFDTYTSLWVAYTLESRHMGDNKRPSSWEYNPNLSISSQVNLCNRSYSDNYSRGHLIPNASRDGNSTMQEQTFYVTNSVPQVQDGFNGGIWNSLERALQGIALEERIYIVTGVAFEKMGEERNVTYTSAKDEPLKRVPVPNYFYKVALKIKYDTQGSITDARAIGFWFENRSYKGRFSDHSTSVDTIEAWTGFDFFPNLADEIESRAEQNAKWHLFSAF